MIRSLSMRLFLGTTLVSALVLGILSFAIHQAVSSTLQGEFDRELLEKARSLASMVEQHDLEIHFDYQESQFPEFESGSRPAYFQIILDGKTFQRSPSLAEGNLTSTTALSQSMTSPVALPNGRPGRMLLMPFEPFLENELDDKPAHPETLATFHRPQGLLAVAQDTADLDRTLARIGLLTISLCAAAALLSGAALLLVVRRAVRPVRALAAQIETLHETSLSAALDPTLFPPGLAPVVDRLNGLFTRLDEAFTRKHAFTADVAHELRTPLAGLLATLEVCRSRPRDASGYEIAIDKSLAMLTSMQTLIENLLLLARADSGQLKTQRTPVDVNSLLAECHQTFDAAARRRGIDISMPPSEPALYAAGDREFLRIILNNLLDNAVSYSPPNSQIDIRVIDSGTSIAIEVSNTGHALAPADLPRLFERFWRKDSSRSATGLHAGLGLSLSQRLIHLQAGQIILRLEGGRFIARVELSQTPAPAFATA